MERLVISQKELHTLINWLHTLIETSGKAERGSGSPTVAYFASDKCRLIFKECHLFLSKCRLFHRLFGMNY